MDKRFKRFFEMKPIKGQILLSIHQYFPTEYIRMAKKSQGMMNLFVENISEKVRKGIMDCDLESSSLEISNQTQPLFTLTAEEVEIVEDNLTLCLDLFNTKGLYDEEDQIIKLLTKLRNWQDEQTNNNNS